MANTIRPRPLRWFGDSHTGAYQDQISQIDEGIFVRGGLPRIWNGEVQNGGSLLTPKIPLEKCDFATPLREWVKANGPIREDAYLNLEHLKPANETARPWIVRMIEAVKEVGGFDIRIGQFDNRMGFETMDLFDFHLISVTSEGSFRPIGYEKEFIETWIRQRHRQLYETKARFPNAEIIPLLHIKDMNGDTLRTALGLLAAMPTTLFRRICFWTNVLPNTPSTNLELLHAGTRMDELEAIWARLDSLRYRG